MTTKDVYYANVLSKLRRRYEKRERDRKGYDTRNNSVTYSFVHWCYSSLQQGSNNNGKCSVWPRNRAFFFLCHEQHTHTKQCTINRERK